MHVITRKRLQEFWRNHPDAERADEHHGKVFDSIDKHEADDLKKQKIGKLINKEKCVMCGHDKKWLWCVTYKWDKHD